MIVLALALVLGIATGLLIVAMILGIRVVRSERGLPSLLSVAGRPGGRHRPRRRPRRRPHPDQGKQPKA